MSRIGKHPVVIPKGVTATIEGNKVHVKGPKGELERTLHAEMKVSLKDGQILVERPSDEDKHKALHGLSRTLVANVVEGVTNGFKKELELVGVGYKAEQRPYGLQLTLGFSHPVKYEAEGNQAERASADLDHHRGREQGNRGAGCGGAAQPQATRALQGQGNQVRWRTGPPQSWKGGQGGSQVMPKMARPKSRDQLRTRRHFRLRKKVVGSAERPRLVVYRSLKHIYAQLVDDTTQRTIMTVTDSGLCL